MEHHILSERLELSLEQVEWAFAMSQIVLSFEDLSLDRQDLLFVALCGKSPDLENSIGSNLPYKASIADCWQIWQAENWDNVAVSPMLVHWYLSGLSQPTISEQIMQVLGEFAEEDLQIAAEQQRLAERNTEENILFEDAFDTHNTLVETFQSQLAQLHTHHTKNGLLILRFWDSAQRFWVYLFPPASDVPLFHGAVPSLHREVLSDLSLEAELLRQWMAQHPTVENIPISILYIEQKTPERASQQHRVSNENTVFGIEKSMNFSNHQFQHTQSGKIDCAGGIRADLSSSHIHIDHRRIQIGYQRLLHWALELKALQKPKVPFSFLFQQTIHQSIRGEGGRGGFLQLKNSSFSQYLLDDQWIAGTHPEQHPITLPKIAAEQPASKRQTWLDIEAIDLSEACSNLEQSVEPIFNQTPPIQKEISEEIVLTGTGFTLNAWNFVELSSKGWQSDQSTRTQLHFSNQTQSTFQGALVWENHQLDWLPEGLIQWTIHHPSNPKQFHIHLNIDLPTQSIESRIPITGQNGLSMEKDPLNVPNFLHHRFEQATLTWSLQVLDSESV